MSQLKKSSLKMSNKALGVPQESMLGTPIFIILYINDMYRSSNRMRFVHVAYDSTESEIKTVQATLTGNW